MTNNDSSDFKFSGGEDRQEALLQRKRKNRRTAKSGARLTLFFMVLLLVLGGLFAVAYMDIKKRVALLEETGERNVEEMVETMEAQVAQVTERYEALQTSLTKKVFPMDEIFLALESSTSALEDQLKNLEERMAALKAAQTKKADQDDLEQAVAGVTDTLTPLAERLDTLTSRIEASEVARSEKLASLEEAQAAYDERLSSLTAAVQEYVDAAAQVRQDVDESIAKMSREIAGMKTKMSALTSVAIDQKTLEEALNSQQAGLSRRINQLSAAIKQNDETLQNVRSWVYSVERTAKDAARKLEQNPPKTIRTPPQPGTFLEQDLD